MSMFGGTSSPSLADIAAVTDRNNNDGFGGNNGWWVLIILFALFGGWGNNGRWGNNAGGENGGGTTIIEVPACNGGNYMGGGYGFGFNEAALQRGFDNQSVIGKLEGINGGICSLGYDQLAQMNAINNNITQSAFGLQQAINNSSVANMQDTNSLSRQFADCCCENRAAIAQVRYDMATDTCAITNQVHQTGDAIIQNQNDGFRNLNDTIRQGFTDLAMQQKDLRISELEAKLNNCDRDSALMGMANYVINKVSPCAVPAYVVPNPNCCYNGNNNGCCGNFQNSCCG